MHIRNWKERLLRTLYPSQYPHLDSFIEDQVPYALEFAADKLPIPVISEDIFMYFESAWCTVLYIAVLVVICVVLHVLHSSKRSLLLSRLLSGVFFILLITKIISHAMTCQHVSGAMGKLTIRPGIEGYVGIQYLYSPLVLVCELMALLGMLHTLFVRRLMKALTYKHVLNYLFWLLFVANLVIFSMYNDILPPLVTIDGIRSTTNGIVGYVLVMYGLPFCGYVLYKIGVGAISILNRDGAKLPVS